MLDVAVRHARIVPACFVALAALLSPASPLYAQAGADTGGTRLLREPTLSATQVAFEYGGDLWVVGRTGGEARRLTSTPAIETDPHFSPDGKWVAFTSNRTGSPQVWVVSSEGGEPRRLTWHPSPSYARGWTPDGKEVLYASDRGSAPVPYAHLWLVPAAGGPPHPVPEAMAFRGSFSPDGRRLVVDRVDRWDTEFRNYRGGQNTPLTILDRKTLDETKLPNERTTDTWPVWLGDEIWFLSDRDHTTNVWSYDPSTKALAQVTHFTDADVKTLGGGAKDALAFEEDGWIWLLDPATGKADKLDITVRGDFPWAMPHWEDVSREIASASLSPTGKRALFESRGDIFTVPAEEGDVRDLTRSPGAADRSPMWSPDGEHVAWFSDAGEGYRLLVGDQKGLETPRAIPLGEQTRYAWSATWSPDGKHIAWVDQRARIHVLDVASGKRVTADTDGTIQNRGGLDLTWSPDSKWLAYAKEYPNHFHRIVVWSLETGKATALTDAMADAASPAWDKGGRWLYFLASTDLGLASGWANLSNQQAKPTYGAYVAVLRAGDATPFAPRSDEEGGASGNGSGGQSAAAGAAAAKSGAKSAAGQTSGESASKADSAVQVRIDPDGIARRIVALPVPVRRYQALAAGEAGTVFLAERVPDEPGLTLHRFDMEKRKEETFASGVRRLALSEDGSHILLQQGPGWHIVGTATPPKPGGGAIHVTLRMRTVPSAEWRQIFQEAWRIERDFFYAPNLHGADWPAVHARYAPLVPWVRSREDLRYVLDQVGGELSVGHSFTGGGDYPAVDTVRTGLLGADLEAHDGRWRITRILTSESWNPDLRAPLAAPGVRAAEGDYLLAVNGRELTASENPYRLLDGTADRQTVLRLNGGPSEKGSWTVTVVPVRSEVALRQRAWVEDNRRTVDSLSHGRLAYVWVPNTGGGGFVSFNRYFFAQQDRDGAVIDERFNGGGLLDDYMVDMMGRKLIGGITNDAAGGKDFRLPEAGVLGPKVLLINERAGSGGDYFPWAFRQHRIGPLLGARTWGGLVAACVPYPLVDGGYITSPCSAVYSGDHWVAENQGVPPDIPVYYDAKDWATGRDPQLERAVREALELLKTEDVTPPGHPPFPDKARRAGQGGGDGG
ncbi:MAG: PDZ domain-containing protein [Candidatus Palauibacterales bacterium]|nr:PDZ domain-containing protein [Candidatus Palauibacterales bacterium]